MATAKGVHVVLALPCAPMEGLTVAIVDPQGGNEFGALAEMDHNRLWPQASAPTDAEVWSPASADLLARAADLIERDGWLQSRFSDGRRVCAHAAIIRSVPAHEITGREAAARALHHWLVETGQVGYYDGTTIAQWNDRPGMTKETVVAALRSAAAYTQAKASEQGASAPGEK